MTTQPLTDTTCAECDFPLYHVVEPEHCSDECPACLRRCDGCVEWAREQADQAQTERVMAQRPSFYGYALIDGAIRLSPVYKTMADLHEPDWTQTVATYPNTRTGTAAAAAESERLNHDLQSAR